MCAMPKKMHDDEVDINHEVVRHLLDTQFPAWRDEPLLLLDAFGTDHVIFRLGDDKTVRLPRIEGATNALRKEQQWLAYLAPHLPLEIPKVIAIGEPNDAYPYPWAIHSWLEGDNISISRLHNPQQAVADLAQFVIALRSIPTDIAKHDIPQSSRNVALAKRDEATRYMIAQLKETHDTIQMTHIWDKCLQAEAWDGRRVWIHTDLQAGNLLMRDGALSAVIDWGMLGMGDPAVDLQVAWNLLTPDLRRIFRDEVQADDATWQRGRGWALSVAVIALPYYVERNPWLANIARHTLEQVLHDFEIDD
jgi:aminoglycoside phosphotransferase (APT) family kinase protein